MAGTNSEHPFLLVASIALALAGCRHHEPPSSIADSGVTVPAPAASTPATAGEARRAVIAWNDALTQHDVDALSALYDDSVRYYGRVLPKAAVLRAKRAAFIATSTFRQEIVGEVRVDRDGDMFVASFVKRSGAAGTLGEARAKVVLRYVDAGGVVVVEETDEATERRHATSSRDACEKVAERVVNDQPQVKRAVASAEAAAAASHDRAHFGGVGPIDDDEGGFSAGIGIHTGERFEQPIAYQVDRAGQLSVSVYGEDLALPPSALREVARVCAAEKP